MTPEKKLENEKVNEFHMKMKSKARNLMLGDKENVLKDRTVCCANFDFQKVLTTPRTEISLLYYLRKLSVWNFTIFELGVAQGHSYVWNETIGNRGSNEVASIVLSFIELKASSGVKKFFFYTDNCSGQNRNRNLFSMYAKACHDLDVEITHR